MIEEHTNEKRSSGVTHNKNYRIYSVVAVRGQMMRTSTTRKDLRNSTNNGVLLIGKWRETHFLVHRKCVTNTFRSEPHFGVNPKYASMRQTIPTTAYYEAENEGKHISE